MSGGSGWVVHGGCSDSSADDGNCAASPSVRQLQMGPNLKFATSIDEQPLTNLRRTMGPIVWDSKSVHLTSRSVHLFGLPEVYDQALKVYKYVGDGTRF